MEGPNPISSGAITVTTQATAIRLPLGSVLRAGMLVNTSTGGQAVFFAFSKDGPYLPLGAGDANGCGGDVFVVDHEDTSEKGGKKLRIDAVWIYASASGGILLVVPSDLGV